ncbi:MAG TPA: Yip1 family protein [Polyangia bacterium]
MITSNEQTFAPASIATAADGTTVLSPPTTRFERFAEAMLSPRVFFQRQPRSLTKLEKVLAAATLGTTSALGNSTLQAMTSTPQKVAAILLTGTFASFIGWYVGKFVMRVQIALSGGKWRQDEALIDAAFAYSSLPYAIPILLLSLPFVAPGDGDTHRIDVYAFLILGLIWSCYIRCIAFRSCFATKRWRTYFWVGGYLVLAFSLGLGWGIWRQALLAR